MKIIVLFLANFFYVSASLILTAADGPHLSSGDCYFQEHTINDDLYNRGCLFIFRDNNKQLGLINFTIEEPECQIFRFRYSSEPKDDDTSADMYFYTTEELDYTEKDSYSCTVNIKDAAGATSSANINVHVFTAPQWTVFPRVKIITEEEYSDFVVTAKVDGLPTTPEIQYYFLDDLNERITYLQDSDFSAYIEKITGTTTIYPVDRDKGINSFTLNFIAQIFVDNIISTTGHMLVLVNDIDDNSPIINKNIFNPVLVPENATKVSLRISVKDADIGPNSVYDVNLRVPSKLKSAIDVSPFRGSGSTEFKLEIDTKRIDFSDSMLTNSSIEFETVGVKNSNHTDSLNIIINLSKYEGSRGGVVIVTTWLILLSTAFSILYNSEH